MVRLWLSAILAGVFSGSIALADDLKNFKNEKGMEASTPVFSQLVIYQLPKHFTPANENTNGRTYIQESTINHEPVENWTQLITLTGVKGIAEDPDLHPIDMANRMVSNYQPDCPDSFSSKSISDEPVSGNEAFWAYFSCGRATSSPNSQSESAVMIFIRGKHDYYTLQVAEHRDGSDKPIEYDGKIWIPRIESLFPVTLVDLAK